MTLTWIAAAYNMIGTFFWLLTSYLFLKYLKTGKNLNYLFAVLSFLFTIGSFEFSVVWPAVWGFYLLIFKRKSLYEIVKLIFPFAAISAIYLVLRLFLIKVPQIPEYKLALNFESAKALFWYIQWAFNIPEEFKKQITNGLVIFNAKFVSEYFLLIVKSYTAALIVVLLSIALPLYNAYQTKGLPNTKLITFSLFWFFVAISPVLLLPNHTFSMYLTLSSIGIYLGIAYLLVNFTTKPLILLTLAVFLFSSYTTISFYKINSWMVNSQKTGGDFATSMKSLYSNLPDNSIVFYHLNSNWEKQALMDSHSIQAIYDNPTLLIYYNKEELLKVVKNDNSNRKIYVNPNQ